MTEYLVVCGCDCHDCLHVQCCQGVKCDATTVEEPT